MLKIAEHKKNHQMIMQIHDELVFEVPQEEAEERHVANPRKNGKCLSLKSDS